MSSDSAYLVINTGSIESCDGDLYSYVFPSSSCTGTVCEFTTDTTGIAAIPITGNDGSTTYFGVAGTRQCDGTEQTAVARDPAGQDVAIGTYECAIGAAPLNTVPPCSDVQTEDLSPADITCDILFYREEMPTPCLQMLAADAASVNVTSWYGSFYTCDNSVHVANNTQYVCDCTQQVVNPPADPSVFPGGVPRSGGCGLPLVVPPFVTSSTIGPLSSSTISSSSSSSSASSSDSEAAIASRSQVSAASVSSEASASLASLSSVSLASDLSASQASASASAASASSSLSALLASQASVSSALSASQASLSAQASSSSAALSSQRSSISSAAISAESSASSDSSSVQQQQQASLSSLQSAASEAALSYSSLSGLAQTNPAYSSSAQAALNSATQLQGAVSSASAFAGGFVGGQQDNTDGGNHTGAIVGGVVGGVAGILLLLGLGSLFVWRRKRKLNEDTITRRYLGSDDDIDPFSSSSNVQATNNGGYGTINDSETTGYAGVGAGAGAAAGLGGAAAISRSMRESRQPSMAQQLNTAYDNQPNRGNVRNSFMNSRNTPLPAFNQNPQSRSNLDLATISAFPSPPPPEARMLPSRGPFHGSGPRSPSGYGRAWN